MLSKLHRRGSDLSANGGTPGSHRSSSGFALGVGRGSRLALLATLVAALAAGGCGDESDPCHDDRRGIVQPGDPSVACGDEPDPCRDDPSAPLYDVTFSVASAGPLGSLQFQALYTGSCGGWQGRRGDVECESLVNAMAAFNAPSGNTVSVALVNAQAQGIRLGDVARCTFRSPDYTSSGSFDLTLVDAADTNSREISPPPTLSVSVQRR